MDQSDIDTAESEQAENIFVAVAEGMLFRQKLYASIEGVAVPALNVIVFE